ncbi:unnamed protein product [Didymodactylos carnosus]|uniref:Uncharacterized protein n=1 Tax=Didymodactylos carnosus TaxID=1234261 RepID=A0A814KRJ5_9BILA|nr:unnamed protein product [Didymodactylos carnosus]CAF1128810.1 unnamed protein product [Didymodactylos carnosus]CAF3825007.1 unnamed protein product [Didymodactylos carnosus]CAF3909765.1 unnamed protein product [Didymodactylos carnosus]
MIFLGAITILHECVHALKPVTTLSNGYWRMPTESGHEGGFIFEKMFMKGQITMKAHSDDIEFKVRGWSVDISALLINLENGDYNLDPFKQSAKQMLKRKRFHILFGFEQPLE